MSNMDQHSSRHSRVKNDKGDRGMGRYGKRAVAHQLEHKISVRVMNIDRSSCRMTAPGTVS